MLAILIAAVLGPSVANVILTLSLTRWVIFGRVAGRRRWLSKNGIRARARSSGGGARYGCLLKHIIPATVPPLLVVATVEVGLVIIAEASLSFLDSASRRATVLGADGRDWPREPEQRLVDFDHAGAALSLLVLAIGLFGDQLRDELDPTGTKEVIIEVKVKVESKSDERIGCGIWRAHVS